jgi:3-phenylpropionate/cinnamic acid dioxygenase small subunit
VTTSSFLASSASPIVLEIGEVLNDEAYLLDHGEHRQWLESLAEDIDYKARLLTTRERAAGTGYATDMYHYDDNYASLAIRVRRLETDTAWAEDPPSRTRRLVTNVRVSTTDIESEYGVRSYLVLLRSRLDWPTYQMLSCERQDIWRTTAGGWRLRRRDIYVDQSVLGLDNLAVFL